MDMPVVFGLLALCAVFGPRGDVSVDSCPNKPLRFVASLPGWAMLWMLLKTARRCPSGTSGRHTPVDVSPASLWLPTV
jgi:hypothetical protein